MDKKEGFGIYEWTGKQIFKGHFKEDYRDGFGKLYRILKKSSPEYDSLELREELVYQGMWSKGK